MSNFTSYVSFIVFFSSSFFLNSFFLDFKANHVLEKCHDCDVFFHKAFKSLDHEFEQDVCKNGLVTIHTPFPFCRQNKAHGSSFIYSLSMSYINNNIRFDCLGSQGSNDISLQKIGGSSKFFRCPRTLRVATTTESNSKLYYY